MNIQTIQKEYENNRRLHDYVNKYCITYGYTLQEALTHALVRDAYLYYTEDVDHG